tara:strand:- start:1 stop:516 length:516 start_codon:yes stop_codon:yes gene_type:complete
MKKNKSSELLLPMLGGNKTLFMYDTLLHNCYAGTSEDKDCIVLVYIYSNTKLFSKFERAIIRLRSFEEAFDIGKYTVFIFKVPSYYKREYIAFINSKYSKFSLEYKLQILSFHDQEIEDRLGQILFRSDELRRELEYELDVTLPDNSELYSCLDMKKEIFNLNYIKHEHST